MLLWAVSKLLLLQMSVNIRNTHKVPPSIPSNCQLICILGLVLTSVLSRLKRWGINYWHANPSPGKRESEVWHGSDCHAKLHGHFFKPIIKPTDSYYENHFNQLRSVTWISLSESALSVWQLCTYIVSYICGFSEPVMLCKTYILCHKSRFWHIVTQICWECFIYFLPGYTGRGYKRYTRWVSSQ